MNKINKINVCCQKVLPLVYDESLSYYEVLCKVIQKLNELIKINNNIRDEVHSDYLAVLEGAKVATEAVASVTAMRDEVLTLKQATEQYANDVVTVYNQTVEARNTAIAKADIAEQSASTASAKADIAQASATTATEKANIAVQSAETATQKANIATEKADSIVQSANTATEKAELAVQSANTATAKADIAVESANTATEKANIASTSATTATQKAESAVQSANTAIAKADIALESANTATEKANIASTSATTATQKATEAQTNADKVLTAMSLVSGTINYYKGDNIEMTIYGGENDSMSVTITPTIRNNVLYIYGNVTQELTGQVTIHLPNIVTKAVNMAQVFDWAKTVLPNIDVNNLPYVTFGGGNGNTYTNGATQEKLISTVAGKSIGAPWYSLNMQLFSNTLTEITVPYQSGTTLKYSFTIIQPLVFTNEVTPDPTDYITKLNEETQAREQADTQLQNNINTEKTARENADAQLQTNIDTLSNDVFHKNQVVPIANGGTGASDANSALTNLFGDMRWIQDVDRTPPNFITYEGCSVKSDTLRAYNNIFLSFPYGLDLYIKGTYKQGFNTALKILLKGVHKNTTTLPLMLSKNIGIRFMYQIKDNYFILYFYIIESERTIDGSIGLNSPNLICIQ